MIVSFESIDKFNEKIEFETEGFYDEGVLSFKDLSMPNTMIYVQIVDDGLAIIRDGNVNMDSFYSLNKNTTGIYEGNGLKFNFRVITRKLEINSSKIHLDYLMFVDGDEVGHNKITITLR